MFAVLQPVVGGLYPSGLRGQKEGTDRSHPMPKQNLEALRWLGGQLLTVTALRGVVAAPGLIPKASPAGCHIACS